jgi:hypothetical protein
MIKQWRINKLDLHTPNSINQLMYSKVNNVHDLHLSSFILETYGGLNAKVKLFG